MLNGTVYKAVTALRRVIDNGYAFHEPDSVIKAREKYRAENNTVIAFWNECMEQHPGGRRRDNCTTSRVYAVYKLWCGDNNHGYAKSAHEFRAEICGLLGAEYDDACDRSSGGMFYRNYTLMEWAKEAYSRALD